MIIYYYDFKNYFTQKFVFEKILLDIFKVQEIRRKSNRNFLFFPKLAKFGHIYRIIWGYFSQGKCTFIRKKEKKFSRSKENEVRRVIFFVKMLLFIQ
jgi:hypothetical protein